MLVIRTHLGNNPLHLFDYLIDYYSKANCHYGMVWPVQQDRIMNLSAHYQVVNTISGNSYLMNLSVYLSNCAGRYCCQTMPFLLKSSAYIADVLASHALLEMWCDDHTVNWCEHSATGVTPRFGVMFSPVK